MRGPALNCPVFQEQKTGEACLLYCDRIQHEYYIHTTYIISVVLSNNNFRVWYTYKCFLSAAAIQYECYGNIKFSIRLCSTTTSPALIRCSCNRLEYPMTRECPAGHTTVYMYCVGMYSHSAVHVKH